MESGILITPEFLPPVLNTSWNSRLMYLKVNLTSPCGCCRCHGNGMAKADLLIFLYKPAFLGFAIPISSFIFFMPENRSSPWSFSFCHLLGLTGRRVLLTLCSRHIWNCPLPPTPSSLPGSKLLSSLTWTTAGLPSTLVIPTMCYPQSAQRGPFEKASKTKSHSWSKPFASLPCPWKKE